MPRGQVQESVDGFVKDLRTYADAAHASMTDSTSKPANATITGAKPTDKDSWAETFSTLGIASNLADLYEGDEGNDADVVLQERQLAFVHQLERAYLLRNRNMVRARGHAAGSMRLHASDYGPAQWYVRRGLERLQTQAGTRG